MQAVLSFLNNSIKMNPDNYATDLERLGLKLNANIVLFSPKCFTTCIFDPIVQGPSVKFMNAPNKRMFIPCKPHLVKFLKPCQGRTPAYY